MAVGLPNRRRVLFAMVAAGFAAGDLLQSGAAVGAGLDDNIGLDKVPAKVKEAASKAVPGARWTVASKSVEEGVVTYELEGEDATRRKVWVDLTADGKVNEMSYLIEFSKVPGTVTAALKKKMPRFQVSTSYEALKDGKVFGYYFDGKRPRDKEEISVSVSADGKDIEVDEG